MLKSFTELLLVYNAGCDVFCNKHKFYSWYNAIVSSTLMKGFKDDVFKKGHCKYTTHYLVIMMMDCHLSLSLLL